MYLMEPYDNALEEILSKGVKKSDRTGVGCISVAGLQRKYSLETEYFPIITGRKVFPKAVFAELLWVISGSTFNQDLEALGAKFWGKWCDESNPRYRALREKYEYDPGDFGPIYGWQLRHFGGDYIEYRRAEKDLKHFNPEAVVYGSASELKMGYEFQMRHSSGFDQLAYMIDILKNDPYGSNGRRCMFSLWNPCDLDKMALPPCHFTYQAIPNGDGTLTGILTQRSCDFPVGVPANIQFYSALTIMLAQQSGFKPKEFIHNTNDSHIYLDQIDQVKEYLTRVKPDSPKLTIEMAADIFSYSMNNFKLEDYYPLDKIDIPVAV